MATQFTCVLALPPEVQVMIWRFTLAPRVIEIEFTKTAAYTRAAPPPATLHVSCGSRAVIQKPYPICFHSIWHKIPTRISYDLDIIFPNGRYYEDACHFFTVAGHTDLHKIRYLAIGACCQCLGEDG